MQDDRELTELNEQVYDMLIYVVVYWTCDNLLILSQCMLSKGRGVETETGTVTCSVFDQDRAWWYGETTDCDCKRR